MQFLLGFLIPCVLFIPINYFCVLFLLHLFLFWMYELCAFLIMYHLFFFYFYLFAGMFLLIVCFCSMFFKFCTIPQFHPSMYPTFLLTIPSCSPPSLHRMQYAPICLSINALFAMRMTLGRGGEWMTRSLWDDATWVAVDPENTLIPTFLPHSKPAVRFITFLLIFFWRYFFFFFS